MDSREPPGDISTGSGCSERDGHGNLSPVQVAIGLDPTRACAGCRSASTPPPTTSTRPRNVLADVGPARAPARSPIGRVCAMLLRCCAMRSPPCSRTGPGARAVDPRYRRYVGDRGARVDTTRALAFIADYEAACRRALDRRRLDAAMIYAMAYTARCELGPEGLGEMGKALAALG